MSEPALERLRQGPVLCDGAMGTMLYARAGASLMHGRCFDELVLTDPGLVQEIHRDYIRAGAQIINSPDSCNACLNCQDLSSNSQAGVDRVDQPAGAGAVVAHRMHLVQGVAETDPGVWIAESERAADAVVAERARVRPHVDSLGGVQQHA